MKKETIDVEAGTFDCVVVEPLSQSVGVFKHEGRLKVWLTDDRIKLPVLMVTIGGIATFVMLIIVVIAGAWFRFGPGEKVLPPGKFYKFALILCCLSILAVGIYGVVQLF